MITALVMMFSTSSVLAADYRDIDSMKALPAPVLSAFYEKTQGERMADRDQPFEATDAISDSSLPRRRFVLGGLSKQFVLLLYERGGRGHSRHVAIFELHGSTAAPVFFGDGPTKVRSTANVIRYLKRHRIKNEVSLPSERINW